MRTNNSGWNLNIVEVLEGDTAANRSKSYMEVFYGKLNPKKEPASGTDSAATPAVV